MRMKRMREMCPPTIIRLRISMRTYHHEIGGPRTETGRVLDGLDTKELDAVATVL
jgi:hypothetical protein